KTEPVANVDASDAKYIASPPNSYGSPSRFIGTKSSTWANSPPGSNIGLVISVFIYPGAIAFTRMLCDTHSDAMHFVIIATAAFEALYAHCASVLAMKLDMDAIFIIDPDLFSIIF